MSQERPLLFNGPMVRAVLAGQKTQTRRLITGSFVVLESRDDDPWPFTDESDDRRPMRCPYGRPGDRLWVRETWAPADEMAYGSRRDEPCVVAYQADRAVLNHEHKPGRSLDTYAWAWDRLRWRPSIHMPRWASRITLEVTGVRVQQLQKISEADVQAEGLSRITKDNGQTWKWGIPDRDGLPGTDDDGMPWSAWSTDPRRAFACLWDSINGARAPWTRNPWVWVVTFKHIKGGTP